MDSKRVYPIIGLVVIILAAGGYWYLSNQSVNTYEVIFKIGSENNAFTDFKMSGFRGQSDYTCSIGVDNVNDTFPMMHYTPDASDQSAEAQGVEYIKIIFTLDTKYSNLVLRLVRGGAETTVVVVDGENDYRVSNDMLGSAEGFTVGQYNLELGPFNKGTHTIELTVTDGEKGNGGYQWDALSLFNSPK